MQKTQQRLERYIDKLEADLAFQQSFWPIHRTLEAQREIRRATDELQRVIKG